MFIHNLVGNARFLFLVWGGGFGEGGGKRYEFISFLDLIYSFVEIS